MTTPRIAIATIGGIPTVVDLLANWVNPDGPLSPGASWSGTAGSGGSPPAESATLRGSGWPQKAIGNYDEPPIAYLSADLRLTVACGTADPAGIQEVMAWCEGRTFTQTKQTLSARTGAIGYAFTLMHALFVRDGDAQVYFYIRPYNGYERRVGPINVTALGTGVATITRAQRYVSFVAGNDTTGDGLTTGTAWKTAMKAMQAAPSGAIVDCASGATAGAGTVTTVGAAASFSLAHGLAVDQYVRLTSGPQAGQWQRVVSVGSPTTVTLAAAYIDSANAPANQTARTWKLVQGYVEDSNGVSNNVVARHITFRRGADAPDVGDVIITRTSRVLPETRFLLRASNVKFSGVCFDLAKFCLMQNGTIASVNIFSGGSQLIDTNGEAGPVEMYPLTGDLSNTNYFASTTGSYWALLESPLVNSGAGGIRLYRGSDSIVSSDAVLLATLSDGTTCINSTVEQTVELPQRLHTDSFLTVASATYNSGTGQTTIVWSGAPTINAKSAQPFQYVRVITSSTITPGTEFDLLTQVAGTFTTTMTGNASALAPGDTCRVYIIGHPDTAQVLIAASSAANRENVIFQRYRTNCISAQLVFLQAGGYTGAGTVSTSGAALTCSTAHGLVVNDFVHLTNGSQGGEYRRVQSVDSSTTATLASAFSVDQTGRAWQQGKTIKDMLFQACVLNMTGVNNNQGQFQHGHQHVVIQQSTLTGAWATPPTTAGLGGTMSLRQQLVSAFGVDGCAIRDSVLKSIGSDAGLPFPTVGLTIDNMHYETGTPQGSNTSVGFVTYDANHRIVSGVTRAVADPKVLWNALGEPLASGCLVGGMG